jgi:hypothetical protein
VTFRHKHVVQTNGARAADVSDPTTVLTSTEAPMIWCSNLKSFRRLEPSPSELRSEETLRSLLTSNFPGIDPSQPQSSPSVNLETELHFDVDCVSIDYTAYFDRIACRRLSSGLLS